ncbi:MAG: hypothetical protein K6C13_01190 [Oscillospiraceae bacterium]|nr:hypothetical protein [Oscillospiraceae bacterium]
MSKVIIKGIIAGAPAPETKETYTRFEVPIIPDGKKEPVFAEMYGMRDIPERYPENTRVNIIAERRTKRFYDGIEVNYSDIYAVRSISRAV